MSNGSDERKFLHDISTPLGTALCLIDMLQEEIKSGNISVIPPASDGGLDALPHLSKTIASLDKLRQMLEERREVLVQRGVPSSKPDAA